MLNNKIRVAGIFLVPAVVLAVIVEQPLAWIILYASYWVPVLSEELKRSVKLLVIFWLILSVHHVLSIANLFTALPGAGEDTSNLHAIAVAYADDRLDYFNPGAIAYGTFIGLFYKLGGISVLLGQTLSVLAWGLSVVFLLRLITELSIGRYATFILLVYGLEPYALLLTSQIMREAWQALFLIAIALYSLLCLRSLNLNNVLYLAIALVLFGLTHKALLTLSLAYAIVFSLVLAAQFFRSNWNLVGGLLAACLTVALLFWLAAEKDMAGTQYVKGLVSGKIVKHISWYRNHIDSFNPRSRYTVSVELKSMADLPVFSLAVWWKYHTAPIGMDLVQWRDFYAYMKSVLRLLMLAALVLLCVFEARHMKRYWLIMLTLYLGLNMLWAMGTTNFGQALRHHLISEWILLLALCRLLSIALDAIGRSDTNLTENKTN